MNFYLDFEAKQYSEKIISIEELYNFDEDNKTEKKAKKTTKKAS